MALLDLVDKLIGDILQGNVFTDVDTFSPIAPTAPKAAYQGIPDPSARPLNVAEVKGHPHKDSPIIPPPPHSPPPIPQGPPHVPGEHYPKVPGPPHVAGEALPKVPGPPHIPGEPNPKVPGPPHVPGDPYPKVPGPPHVPGEPLPIVPGPDHVAGEPYPIVPGPPHIAGEPIPAVPGPDHTPGEPIPYVPGAPLVDQRPANADSGVPSVDPRLLNFNDANQHPHDGLAGPGGEHNAKTHIIPTEPNALHDDQGAFLTPSQVAGMLAKQTPGPKRGEIYAGSKFKPGGQELHPDVGEQIDQVSTPLDPVVPRENIYLGSDSSNRIHGPLSDLLAFHEAKTHPHEGKVIPNAPPLHNAESPGYVNKSGKHPAEHGKIGEPVPPRDEIYRNSDPKDDTIRAPADPLASVPPGHPHVGPESQIPNPETRHLPAAQSENLLSHHRPDGYSPSQHGVPPTPVATPKNYDDGQSPLRDWSNIEGPKRGELYTKTPNYTTTPPDVISQKDTTTDLAQDATTRPVPTPPEFTKDPVGEAYDPVRRNDIYFIPEEAKQVKSNVAGTEISKPTAGDLLGMTGQRPPTLNFQGTDADDVPVEGGDFSAASVPDRPLVLERSWGDDSPLGADRRDLASTHHADKFGPNANANPDVLNPLGVPQPHGLIGKVETSDGHRGGQIYSDGYTAVQGPGSEYLKYLDVIAAAKWFENVRKEIGAVIPVITVKAQQDDRNQGQPSTEGIAKSIAWPISQLLLAAFNPTDTAGYGELNAIWNPLSFAGSIIPLLRSTPVTNITVGAAASGIGFGGYSQNVIDSVLATNPGDAPDESGERLLQMRHGTYQKSLDGTTLAQLNLGDAGFKGDITHVGMGPDPNIEATDLLGALANLGSNLLGSNKAVSIAEQVDGETAKEKGMHGNIYTSENPYGAENSYMPLRDLEEFATENPDEDPHAHKLAALFQPTAYPGSPNIDFSPIAYNFIARTSPGDLTSPTQMPDAPGLNAAVTDVGFSPEDYENGVVANVIEEDAIYMPFMFQDLRDTTDQFLYFRAFLKGGISETFTPDWQTERYYGRVDQIPIYQGTIRSLSLTFDVVAWKPADLPTMWRKLEKLQSMVYPFYNTAGFMNSGPIIRMRIGDLFAATSDDGHRGLPGYITSMDWSYDDGVWNTADDFKIPRKVTVSLGFTVLHNGNPGTYPFVEENFPDADALPSDATADGVIFGAGKFTRGDDSVDLKVSRAEIRKIFETVKPSGS